MRRRIIRLAGIGLAVTFGTMLMPLSVQAQLFGGLRRCCPPCSPSCVPAEPTVPTTPATPPTPSTTETPTPTPAPEQTPELPPPLLAGLQGGRGAAFGSPNMFGDAFPDRPSVLTLNLTQRGGVINLATITTNTVGRTKLSDDNNPLPRDRVFFDYDYFNRVPLTPAGQDVHRYTPGFEKTFFDQMASVEVRMPFAATLDSDQTLGATNDMRNAEFGNLHVTLKGLLYANPCLHVAAGLGIDIPTADDSRLFSNNREFLRVRNEAVVLTPYVAYLVTPNDRLFFQNWLAFDLLTNGNSVIALPGSVDSTNVGRLNDQNVLQIDAQLGYWLYKAEDHCAWVTALAPFLELHYNSSINDADGVQFSRFSLAPRSGHFDELNLSTGVVAQFGDNCTLALGAAFPLKEGTNRSFDYQLGVRANFFFGPTARNRSRATAVSGF
jgi:hypothetical protein